MSDYISTVSQPSGRQFIGYLTRASDSFIYNKDTATFENTVLADLVGNARLPYRLAFTEGAPGSYSFTLNVALFQNDEYTLGIRELANAVEYNNISTDIFTVTAGSVTSTDIYISITTTPTRALFAYVQSTSTSKFLSDVDLTLGTLDLATAPITARAVYRHSYSEPTPSNYILEIDASTLPNGTYSIKTYELVGDVEIQAGEDYLIRIQDGKRLSGIDFNTLTISENTGGKDSLRYLQSNGSPVDGAVVTLYLASEYNQGNTANTIGRTTTDASGRWLDPISVNAGTTYTVVFQKRGFYGPDSVEVVV